MIVLGLLIGEYIYLFRLGLFFRFADFYLWGFWRESCSMWLFLESSSMLFWLLYLFLLLPLDLINLLFIDKISFLTFIQILGWNFRFSTFAEMEAKIIKPTIQILLHNSIFHYHFLSNPLRIFF